MKRRLLTILLFLLLGAIVNVLGATCTGILTYPIDMKNEWASEQITEDVCWQVYLYGNWCATLYYSEVMYGRAWSGVPEVDDILPSWVSFDDFPDWGTFIDDKVDWEDPEFGDRALDFRQIRACGWPLRAMWCETVIDSLGATQFDLNGGIWWPPGKTLVEIGDYRRVVPLRPIWYGLAINTVFFGTILWLASCGPLALRRIIRRKRGHCPKCGYDLRRDLNAGCSECGWGRAAESTS